MFVQCSLWPLTLLGNGQVILLWHMIPERTLHKGLLGYQLTIFSGLTHLRPVVCCFVTNWIVPAETRFSGFVCGKKHQLHLDALRSCGRVWHYPTTMWAKAADNVSQRCVSTALRCVSLDGGQGVCMHVNWIRRCAPRASAACQEI